MERQRVKNRKYRESKKQLKQQEEGKFIIEWEEEK